MAEEELVLELVEWEGTLMAGEGSFSHGRVEIPKGLKYALTQPWRGKTFGAAHKKLMMLWEDVPVLKKQSDFVQNPKYTLKEHVLTRFVLRADTSVKVKQGFGNMNSGKLLPLVMKNKHVDDAVSYTTIYSYV